MEHHYAGIDTHSRFHVIVVTDHDGTPLATHHIDNTPDGLARAVDLLTAHPIGRVGIEGTSSYGAAITRLLTDAGLEVVEVTGPDRANRRRRGKSDTIDAQAAADAARTGHRTSPTKHHHHLAELRAHYVLHESATRARTQVGSEIHALATQLDPGTPIGRITLTRARELATHPGPLAIAAQRWLHLDTEAKNHQHAIHTWLQHRHQALLDQPWIGPITAAELVLAAGDNPQRMHCEAAFANLCGVAPVPASSGNHQRHRLNRHGDRRANRALWRIAFLRYTRDQRTIAYVERRTAQHKTRKDILRCLKRYIAREVFPILQAATT